MSTTLNKVIKKKRIIKPTPNATPFYSHLRKIYPKSTYTRKIEPLHN